MRATGEGRRRVKVEGEGQEEAGRVPLFFDWFDGLTVSFATVVVDMILVLTTEHYQSDI